MTDQSHMHKYFIGHVGAIFSNALHFAVYTTNTEVARRLAASGGSIRPCSYLGGVY